MKYKSDIDMKYSLKLLIISFLVLKGALVFGQESKIFLTVNTNNAKLTETEKTDSKVLKVLKFGHSLELIQILYPNGLGSSSRLKVKDEEIEGYITSYFVESNTKLKEMESLEILRLKAEQKTADSIKKDNAIREYLMEKKLFDPEAEIRKNDSIADAMLKKAKEESRAIYENRKIENEKAYQSKRVKFTKKYGQVNGEKVAKGLIWIGMTEEMLIDSWGQPEDINSTVTRYGSRKQYVYGSGQYVYVVNGKVDAWQN